MTSDATPKETRVLFGPPGMARSLRDCVTCSSAPNCLEPEPPPLLPERTALRRPIPWRPPRPCGPSTGSTGSDPVFGFCHPAIAVSCRPDASRVREQTGTARQLPAIPRDTTPPPIGRTAGSPIENRKQGLTPTSPTSRADKPPVPPARLQIHPPVEDVPLEDEHDQGECEEVLPGFEAGGFQGGLGGQVGPLGADRFATADVALRLVEQVDGE